MMLALRHYPLIVALLCMPVAGGGPAAAEEKGPAMKHPVLAHDVDAAKAPAFEKAVARVMAMDEAEMLRLVPTRTGVLFCGCPNCSGGQQENNMFEWNIERPLELRCRFCGQVYPSEKYPAKWTDTGKNALGEAVTYSYYLDEKSNRDYWLEAAADYLRRGWFVSQCLALARAYHATQKPEYARRAALILDRFAEAYPHMAVLNQWPYRRRSVAKPTPPYPAAGGKWGRWIHEEVPAHLPEAYDLIYDCEELDRLSRERGTGVRKRIENDFLRATVEYLLTVGKEPAGDHLHNMAPFYTRGMIQIGRVIGEPEYVHWGRQWVQTILSDRFFYDGMWCEAPSYHYQTIGGVRQVIAALKGYSDPPGYRRPADGTRLDNLDLETQLPVVKKVLGAPNLIAYPNGRICPVHDSWAKSVSSPARERTTSTLLPGFGHAALGCGSGDRQLQAQLHFSGGYGHEHADALHFSLFALGSEMLSDLGYTHTKLRQWTVSTIGHNTVAIDRGNQSTRGSDGDLILFEPDLDGVSVVEVRAERAYPKLAQTYRRLLLLVRLSESDAYVVDLFQVLGGATHDWLLHGSADAEMESECSIPLTPREGTLLEPGEKWVEPVGESSTFPEYGLMRSVQQGKADTGFRVTFRYPEGTPGAGTGVRVHLAAGLPAEAFLARTPRVRPAEGDDRKVYDSLMPQLVVRRRGTAPLASTFVAVHEPFRDRPFLEDVQALPLSPAAEGAAALRIRSGDVTDTLIATSDEPPYPERRLPDGTVVQARIALIRERAGKPVAAWLIEGSRVSRGDVTLTAKEPRYEGTLTSATRKADGAAEDAFLTPAALAEGGALAGRWMVVTHGNGHTHAYEIRRVEKRGDVTAIILSDDHGLRIDGEQTEECFFPRRKMDGANRFRISGRAVWRSP